MNSLKNMKPARCGTTQADDGFLKVFEVYYMLYVRGCRETMEETMSLARCNNRYYVHSIACWFLITVKYEMKTSQCEFQTRL